MAVFEGLGGFLESAYYGLDCQLSFCFCFRCPVRLYLDPCGHDLFWEARLAEFDVVKPDIPASASTLIATLFRLSG